MLGGAHDDDRADARVRVLVVEEHPLFGEGLRLLVEQDERFTVVGLALTVDEAAARIRELVPDVALVGRCLAHRRALETIGSVRGSTSLVVLANTADDDLLRSALEAGAAAVIDGVAPVADLLRAIHRAGDGDSLFSPSVIADVIRQRALGRGRTARSGGPKALTPRERDVLRLLVEGFDSKGIAARLGLSVQTARDYVQNILEKLGAHSRTEAVVRAGRLGIINIAAIALAVELGGSVPALLPSILG